MNVYDFDKTILDGDSTERFYFFCLRRFPSILKHVPSLAAAFVKYALKITDKTAFKEVMYRFLTELDDVYSLIEEFWDKNIDRVFKWYKKMHREDDVVVSASPEFLLAPACKRLGIKNLIASRVDKKTGKYTGKNCWGAEKTVRFKERFGESKIDFERFKTQ